MTCGIECSTLGCLDAFSPPGTVNIACRGRPCKNSARTIPNGFGVIDIYIYISPPPGRDPPIEFKSPEDSWMEKLFLLSRI